MFFTEYKLPTPCFKMPDEIYINAALLTYKQALEHWNGIIKTPEQALIRVVDWRRTVIKLQQYASNDLVASSLKEALEYLAKAEEKVKVMKPPPHNKSVPEKPHGKSVPANRWRDHWVPPMSW
jgi:hypothetical protein